MKNKKSNNIIIFILCFLISLSSFALYGCESKDDSDTQSNIQPDKIVFADFESYQDGFQMMRPLWGFGKISENEDTKYVTSGTKSAKIQPQGSADGSHKPTVYLPFVSSSLNYNYSDLSIIKSISFDIYNAQNEEKYVETGFVADHEENKSITPCLATKQTLNPGWNNFVIDIGHDFLAKIIDIDNVNGFFWRFDSDYNYALEECDVFYLDNIVFKTCDKVVINEPEPSLVIADFENSYESYLLTSEIDVDIEIVQAQNGIVPTSGFRMYHVKNDAPDLDENGNPLWGYLVLNGRMVKNAMKNVTDMSKAYIEFDVYDNSEPKYVDGVTVDWFLDSGSKITSQMFDIQTQNKKWVTFSCPISKILGQNSDFRTKAGKANLWLKYGAFDLYFDNFRIVEK